MMWFLHSFHQLSHFVIHEGFWSRRCAWAGSQLYGHWGGASLSWPRRMPLLSGPKEQEQSTMLPSKEQTWIIRLSQLCESLTRSGLEYCEMSIPNAKHAHTQTVQTKIGTGLRTSSQPSVGLLGPSLAKQSMPTHPAIKTNAKCWPWLTSLWLKTEENCYVTESDTIPYWRKCEYIQN